MLTPVVFPSGRAKLATRPLPIMSSTIPTTGTVSEARCAARTNGSPKVMMTSTFCATSPPANSGARSLAPSAQTNRKRALWPSSQPMAFM